MVNSYELIHQYSYYSHLEVYPFEFIQQKHPSREFQIEINLDPHFEKLFSKNATSHDSNLVILPFSCSSITTYLLIV